MKRRWFAVVGGFFLIVSAGAVVLLGRDALRTPRFLASILTWLLIGGLSVVGGLRRSVAGVEWYRFVGVGDVLLGLWMLGYATTWFLDGTADRATQVSAVAMAGSGSLLVFIGVDYFVGGRHLDVSAIEPGPLFGGSDP